MATGADQLNLIVQSLIGERRRQQNAIEAQRDHLIGLAKQDTRQTAKHPPPLADQITANLLRKHTSKALGGRTLRSAIGNMSVEKAINNALGEIAPIVLPH